MILIVIGTQLVAAENRKGRPGKIVQGLWHIWASKERESSSRQSISNTQFQCLESS